MNIRYLTVNRMKFKIERYKSNILGEFEYYVLKSDPHPNYLFVQYKFVFKCNLSTLKDNLIKYSLGELLI